jgi:hypothetical protein
MKAVIELLNTLKNYPELNFFMLLIIVCLYFLFIKDKNDVNIKNDIEELKENQNKVIDILEKIEVYLSMLNNKKSYISSADAIIYKETSEFLNNLNKIIDYNNFKQKKEYLKHRLETQTKTFRTQIYENVSLVISDKILLNEIWDIINTVDSEILTKFEEEIKEDKEDHTFLKVSVEEYLKGIRSNLTEKIHLHYKE